MFTLTIKEDQLKGNTAVAAGGWLRSVTAKLTQITKENVAKITMRLWQACWPSLELLSLLLAVMLPLTAK